MTTPSGDEPSGDRPSGGAAGAQRAAEERYLAARRVQDYVQCVRELLGMTVWLPVQGPRKDFLVAHRGEQGLIYAYTSPARITAIASPDIHPENAVRRGFSDLVRSWRHPEYGLVINPETDSEFQIALRFFGRVRQIERELSASGGTAGAPADDAPGAVPDDAPGAVSHPSEEEAGNRSPDGGSAKGPGPRTGVVVPTGRPVRPVPIEPPDRIGGFRFAAMVDTITADGSPELSPERGNVHSDEEKRRLREYLDGGALLQLVTGAVADMFEPGRGDVVPASTRTDGEWIWSDGVAYYLDEYGVAPEPDFYRAIVAAGYRCPTVSAERLAAAGRSLAERQRIASELYQRWRREQAADS